MPVYFGDNKLNSGDGDSLAFNDGSLQSILTQVTMSSNSTNDGRSPNLPTVNFATVKTNILALTQGTKANQTVRQNVLDTGTHFGAISPISQQYWTTP